MELAEQYPIQVVCSWIGNSPQIAAKHYLQVREEHFAKAVGDESAQQIPATPPNLADQWDNLPESKRCQILEILQPVVSAE